MTGAELKADRIAYGMSQSKLAEGLGYARETIARWEACNILPQHVANHVDLYLTSLPHDVTKHYNETADDVLVPTQALVPRPKCCWLDDQRVPLRHDPVTDLAHDALYWESREQPDGTYGPWRHKIRINTMNELDDVFID